MPNDQTYHDENTLRKFRQVLRGYVTPTTATNIIGDMLNQGLLIREKPPWRPEDSSTLESAIFQAIGSGSMCWENPGGAGVFDSDQAKWVADGLLDWMTERGVEM